MEDKWLKQERKEIVRVYSNWNLDVTCQSLSTLGQLRKTYATGYYHWLSLWRLGVLQAKTRQLGPIMNITGSNWTILLQKMTMSSSWRISTPSWCPHWNDSRKKVTMDIMLLEPRPLSSGTACHMPSLLVNFPSFNLPQRITGYKPTRIISIIYRHLIMSLESRFKPDSTIIQFGKMTLCERHHGLDRTQHWERKQRNRILDSLRSFISSK